MISNLPRSQIVKLCQAIVALMPDWRVLEESIGITTSELIAQLKSLNYIRACMRTWNGKILDFIPSESSATQIEFLSLLRSVQ